jgi:hypothetical protein
MIVPCISNLTSFVEVFSVANLAYAGSEQFRGFLKDDLLTLKSDPKFDGRDIEELNAKVELSQDFTKPGYQRYQSDKEAILNRITILEQVCEYKSLYFPMVLQPVFLMSGLYCLTVLIVSGWATSENIRQIYLCLSSSVVVAAFALWLFAASFDRERSPEWPRPVLTILILIAALVGVPLFVMNTTLLANLGLDWDSTKIFFWTTIIAIVAPYLMYFIRAFLFKYHQRLRFFRIQVAKKEFLHNASAGLKYFGVELPEGGYQILPSPGFWERHFEPLFLAMKKYGKSELHGKHEEQLKLVWVTAWSIVRTGSKTTITKFTSVFRRKRG